MANYDDVVNRLLHDREWEKKISSSISVALMCINVDPAKHERAVECVLLAVVPDIAELIKNLDARQSL